MVTAHYGNMVTDLWTIVTDNINMVTAYYVNVLYSTHANFKCSVLKVL